MNRLILLVNNNGIMEISQENPDSNIKVHTYYNNMDFNSHDGITTISPSDMTMLINYYHYVKNNNIQCDFINPNGINTKDGEVE